MDKLKLWDKTPLFDESIDQAEPTLTPYLLNDGKPHGAVIVCPGGGYAKKADHEGGPIALRLNEEGVHGFVLDYRVAPYRHPVPLMDALRAIRYVRYHAQELGVLEGEEGPYGLYIKAVNGIPLDYDKDGAYWGFYVDDAYATAGVDETTIVETSVYRLQAEKG